jgi:hypothetical protein
MSQSYSNVPNTTSVTNQPIVQAYGFYSQPIEFNSTVLAAMKSYFVNRDFGEVAAESIAITIMTQSKQDGYNPMQILDTLKGLDSVQLSALVSEILNYNRFKTSSLGYAQTFKPNVEVQRNIIDGFIFSEKTIAPTILYDETGEPLTDEYGAALTTG